MIYWKCRNCETNNLYPGNTECECCGERMNINQLEEMKRLSFYEMRADEGDSYALMDTAKFYCKGDAFQKDLDKALELMTKAADLGNADAQQELADWYFYTDNDFPSDESMAFEYATKAYRNGCIYSPYFLYTCYLKGYGTQENCEYAIKLLHEAANLGFIAPIEELGNYHKSGVYVEKSDAKAAYYYEQLSVEDNCSNDTAYNIGMMYWHGNGTEVNYKKANEWFNYCIERFNDWGSKIPIAVFHYEGKGFPKNQTKGISLMMQIANNKSDEWASTMANKYLQLWKNDQ